MVPPANELAQPTKSSIKQLIVKLICMPIYVAYTFHTNYCRKVIYKMSKAATSYLKFALISVRLHPVRVSDSFLYNFQKIETMLNFLNQR